jgi:hypothetical protein
VTHSVERQKQITSRCRLYGATSGVALLTALCLTSTASAQNAEWTFAPYAEASEQFTDNVFGTGSNEDSDLVTTLEAGFDITGETRRTEIDLSYSFSQDFYSDNNGLDGYRQNLVGGSQVELWEEAFFVDARITFTEEDLGTAGSTSAGNRTLASDRTQVFNGRISPYFVHNFNNWVTGVAKYGYSETRFYEANVGNAATAPSNQRTNEFEVEANSGTKFTDWKWRARSAYTVSESDVGDRFERFTSLTTGELPLNRLISLLGTIGYDDFNVDNVNDSEISGAFGGAGVRFHPNTRTDAAFQAGYRFGDIVYNVEVSYAPTSQDTLTADYFVNVESADTSLANKDILDQNGDLTQPNFSTAAYVDGVTKVKQFTLAWDGTRGRNGYGLDIEVADRDILDTGLKDKTLAVGANFTRQLTPRADLTLTVNVTDVIDGQTAANEEESYTFGASYSYQLGAGFSATAAYDFLYRDEATGANVRENAVTLSVRKTF